MDTYRKLKQEINSLKKDLKNRDASIENLQFQLDNIMNTRRWQISSRLSQLYHSFSDYFANKHHYTHKEYNPYEYIRLLKDIEVVNLETHYKNIMLQVKFSTATTIYNEGKGVLSFLTSIEKQSLKPDHVVLVDGGSTDATVEFVEQFMQTTKLNIELIKGNKLNIPAGRNEAIRHCTHEIIVLADAGTNLDRHYFRNLLGVLDQYPDADLIGGIYQPMKKTSYSSQFIPDWNKVDWKRFLPSTRSMLLRKSLALKVGLYPEYLETGDDTLFDINYRRLSRQWIFNRKACVFWESPRTNAQYQVLSSRYGSGDGKSGIGDFAFYTFLSSERRGIPIVDTLGRMDYYHGYLEGRKVRSDLEIKARKIQGLVVIFGNLPLHDRSEFIKLWMIKRLLRANYKVIYINLFSRNHPDAYPAYLDLDYTLLELYNILDFDLPEVIKRYKKIATRTYVLKDIDLTDFPEIDTTLEHSKVSTFKTIKMLLMRLGPGKLLLP